MEAGAGERMIIDMHAHFFPYTHKEEDQHEILRAIEQNGINQVYVSAIELDNQVFNEEMVEYANEEAYRFEKAHPKHIRSYCRVIAANRNAADVAKRGIYDHNAVGLKILSDCFMDDHLIDPVAEEAIKANVPILMHTSYKAKGPGVQQYPYESDGSHIANLAKRYPELKIVMAHLGGNVYKAVRDVAEYPNVYADMCGSMNRYGTLQYALERLGDDRIVFGSDQPWIPYDICIGKVQDADLPETVMEKIMYKNTLRFYDRTWRVGDSV